MRITLSRDVRLVESLAQITCALLACPVPKSKQRNHNDDSDDKYGNDEGNKTIKDGDISP